MKISRLSYGLLIIASICAGNSIQLSAQTPFDKAYREEASGIWEHLSLFTDRSIYTVDEYIQFRADHSVNVTKPGVDWSTVMYAELVTTSGKAVSQGKYALKDGVSFGSLHIPESTLTGNYYLKCYTRWMRNAGSETFSYIPLTIVNPNRIELANGINGDAYETALPGVTYRQGEFSCSVDAATYERGAEIRLKISEPFNDYLHQIRGCVTVVPAGTVDTSSGQLVLPSDQVTREDFTIRYLPDLGRGPSISGSVVQSDDTPAPFTTLHFSLLGDDPDFFTSVSDANGRFVLSSPERFGDQEVYVSPDPGEDLNLEVRIDQDFDTSPMAAPALKFQLSPQERELATWLALNKQFHMVYGNQVQTETDVVTNGQQPFYGTRVQQLRMDDYVNLPTLEEVFINLVPNVDAIRRRGKPIIKINSENLGIGIYKPLIMIDNISVFDTEAIMALPPERIDRIDLINEIYLKGSVAFGGIIAIYTKEGDMAGIDLPHGSYFFDYKSLDRALPDTCSLPPTEDHIPDMRNTILWLNDVNMEKGMAVERSFKAPLTRGEYVILVRGLAPTGEIFSAYTLFKVR